ncbi:hypothetical protein PHACT_12055 [Pseudohongiella acticola]|jgi:SAM-dependent methyltransferase|uniref:Class I SAM-dependent methyltransferase n=1 Tax=Pseudohongiella acticola TaxID=1524254 RepID=A0A1E8CMS6_9GAMM|nr:class I SAM-dependent methyltransferase [Pseudohongiella acticola]OFE13776.1 hypothetical protein PHACT_12055 [Pseudohongiella acticola]
MPDSKPAIYLPPSLRGFQPRHIVFSTWIDHLPFGYDLMAALRPRTLVELGTYSGLSFFCFCQAAREMGLPTRSYAVDTWEGDDHTGAYGEDIYRSVQAHQQAQYPDSASLLRMRFDQALSQFEDNSLDMIHLDGLHTRDAVSEDFRQWYPKLRPGGIFLFHDVVARLPGFGVWQFWQALCQAPEHQGNSFTFNQGFGLGVLRKPGNDAPEARGQGAQSSQDNQSGRDSQLLRLLFSQEPGSAARLRRFYAHAASHHQLLRRRIGRQRIAARHRQENET